MANELPAGYDPFGPTPEGLVDRKGTPFNPSLHQAYKGGRAFLSRVGEWVKKGGRPKVAETPVSTAQKPLEKGVAPVIPKGLPTPVDEGDLIKKAVANSPKPIPNTPPPLAPLPEGVTLNGVETIPAQKPESGSPEAVTISELDATAKSAVVLAETLLVMALGKDMVHTGDERAALLEGWKGFLVDKEGIRVPPWAALSIAYLTVVGARADKPNFQKRCEGWAARFKKWFGKG